MNDGLFGWSKNRLLAIAFFSLLSQQLLLILKNGSFVILAGIVVATKVQDGGGREVPKPPLCLFSAPLALSWQLTRVSAASFPQDCGSSHHIFSTFTNIPIPALFQNVSFRLVQRLSRLLWVTVCWYAIRRGKDVP